MLSSKAITTIRILTIVIPFQINIINSILNRFSYLLNKVIVLHAVDVWYVAVLFEHFILLLAYLLSLVLVIEGVTFFKFVNIIELLVFNIKMCFEVSFIVGNEDVHGFRLRIPHDRWVFSIDWLNFTLSSGDILLISIRVIFISCSILNAFGSSSLSNEIL